MFIDAHCHLADARFDPDRENVLARARAARIGYFLQGGVGPEDWARQRTLGDDSWLRCFGLHPWWVAEHDEAACRHGLNLLEAALPDCTALGELGLDFLPRFPKSSHNRQRAVFQDQLALADAHAKPIVLHLVRSHHEALPLLHVGAPWRGIVHAFSGSYHTARALLDLGLLISIGGAVTRTGYQKLKDSVSRLPLDRIVIESDAPDMAPAGHHGELNEPSSLLTTAAIIAKIKAITPETVLEQSRKNLIKAFDLELNRC